MAGGLAFRSPDNFCHAAKAEMVCNGILPIDQLRDVIPPVTHVCLTMPRERLGEAYGISIIKPAAEEKECFLTIRLPTSSARFSSLG